MESTAAPETAPESVEVYEVELAAQQKARRFGRMVVGGGLLAGLAYAYYDSIVVAERFRQTVEYSWQADKAKEEGLQAAGAALAIAGLLAFVLARAVHDLVLAQAQPDGERGRRRMLVGAALGFATAAATATLGYFGWLYAAANATAARDYGVLYGMYGVHRDERAIDHGEVLAATVLAAGVFFLTSRRAGLRSETPLRRQLIAGAAATSALAGVPFALLQVLDDLKKERTVLPLAAGIVAALVLFFVLRPKAEDGEVEVRAAAAKEVANEVQLMRAAIRRNRLGLVAAVATGVVVFFGGWFGLDLLYDKLNAGASYYDRFQPGLGHVFLLVAAATFAGLFVRRLAGGNASAEPADLGLPQLEGGLFDEALAQTAALEVRQDLTLGSVLFGAASRARYQLLDGGSAFCGRAEERGNMLVRLLTGGRRPLDVAVDDLGRTALRIRRSFLWGPGWLCNRARVSEGERQVGQVQQRLSLARSYRVASASGEERYELASGWLFRSRFRILRRGEQVGELRRVRKPWYLRLFTPAWRDPDRFALTFPADAGIDDRRLLTSAVFLIDVTHYPAQAWVRTGPLLAVAALWLVAILFPADTAEPRSGLSVDRHESKALLDEL